MDKPLTLWLYLNNPDLVKIDNFKGNTTTIERNKYGEILNKYDTCIVIIRVKGFYDDFLKILKCKNKW